MTFTGRAQILIAWSTQPFSPSPVWTDVTAWIRLDQSLSMQRGRQDNITTTPAGHLTLTADNSDGRFTAGLSTSPWAPYVKIGRRIQVNVPDEHGTLHTRFDGMITELPTEWKGGPGIESLEVIQAADILAWLGRQPDLLSWTQQEMLADNPVALWSLADTSNVTQASDQAGKGAAPLQIVSQGDGTGAAASSAGVPLTEIQTSDVTAQQQATQTFTFTNPGPFNVTFPQGTLVNCRVQGWAGGTAGTNGNHASLGGPGGAGAEYAEEPSLAITMGKTYSGAVGAGGVPSAGAGGDTTFTGDSVTVTAHGAGTGSTNTIHYDGGSGGGSSAGAAGTGGGSSAGSLQAGNHGLRAGTGGSAPADGGAGGAGDSGGTGAGAGAQPGGGGGGGHASSGTSNTNGGGGGTGKVIITLTYVPPASSQQNSTLPAWLFTPSATLAARILSGPLPQPVTAAAGFAFSAWAAFAGFPAASVTTLTTPGAFTFTGPPGAITADVACWAGGKAGTAGNGASTGGPGGNGGEYAEEQALQITPDSVYAGSVGAAGIPSAGAGGDTTFTGDVVTVQAHGAGTGSSNTIHHDGGSGAGTTGAAGGAGGSSAGPGQPGNSASGGSGGTSVTGGGAGGAGDANGTGAGPGSAPGGGGGGGFASTSASINSNGASGGTGQCLITVQPGVSTLLTLVSPRGRTAIAVWVTSSGHLQLASTSSYGTRSPSWTTVDAGQVPGTPFQVAVSVAAGTATLYVNAVSQGTLTLPAGASYTWITAGGGYGSLLGGWNGSAGLLGIYPAPLTSTRVGVHYTAGTTGFAGSSAGTMIAKIASYAGLPSFWYAPPSGSSDPSYGLSTVSYADLKGQQPLTQMQLYEQAEGGVLSVTAAGKLVFADRAARYAAGSASQPAFVLQAGQYEPDTSYKSNDQYLCTEACYATVNIPGGYPVINTAAEGDYGAYTQNAGTLASPQSAPFADATATPYVYSADDLMDAGNWETTVFGQPASRVPQLTVDLLTLPAAEFSIASFFGCDIGSPVELAGLPPQAPDAAGQPLAAYQVIEGVNETITLDDHTVMLYTSPLSQSAAWIPGDSLLGVLGTTTTVGRSQTPADLGPPYTPVATFGSTLNRTGSAGAQDLRTLTVNAQDRLTPPLLIAQQASAQALTVLAGQPVTFDTALADTAAGLKTVSTYTVPAGYPGWYWCAAVVQAATGISSLGGLAAWFAAVLGGTPSQWHAKAVPYVSSAPYTAVAIAGRIGPCSAGDTIQVIAAAAYGTPPASVPLGTADGGSMFTLLWQGD